MSKYEEIELFCVFSFSTARVTLKWSLTPENLAPLRNSRKCVHMFSGCSTRRSDVAPRESQMAAAVMSLCLVTGHDHDRVHHRPSYLFFPMFFYISV